MSFLVDYTNMPNNIKFYGGNAGFKKGVTIDNDNWIIKYPQDTSSFSNVEISFTTSPLSEYIGSHIYDILGYKVHNTKLGVSYNETINIKQLVVACEDFTQNGKYSLIDYEAIKNSYSNELQAKIIALYKTLPKYETNGIAAHTMPIEEIILQLEENDVFKSHKEAKQLFWDMIIIDCIINNNDRNKNNWGLLKDNTTNELSIAPVYDNGASFVSKHTDEKLERLLSNEKAFKNSVLNGMCYYTVNNKLLNFRNFFIELHNNNLDHDFIEAKNRVLPKVKDKWNEIVKFIENIPENEDGFKIISKTKKIFFIKSMKCRIDELF